MATIVRITGLCVALVGLVLLVFSAWSGPFSPADKLNPLERLRAMRLNRIFEQHREAYGDQKTQEAMLEKGIVVERDGNELVFHPEDGTTAVSVACMIDKDPSAAGEKVMLQELFDALSKNAKNSSKCFRYQKNAKTIYDVTTSHPSLCPGQISSGTAAGFHHRLYAPALFSPVMEGYAARGVLESFGKNVIPECSPGADNCLMWSYPSAMYCGRVDSESTFTAGKEETPVRPVDVAMNLYYYQALAHAQSPEEVAPPACLARPASVFVHAVAREIVTRHTAQDFCSEHTRPLPESMEPRLGTKKITTVSVDPRACNAMVRYLVEDPTQRRMCIFLPDLENTIAPSSANDFMMQVMSFGVFGPHDAQSPANLSPLVNELARVSAENNFWRACRPRDGSSNELPSCAADDKAFWALSRHTRMDVPCDRACRIQKQLRESFSGLDSAIARGEYELPLHIAGAGTHQITKNSVNGLIFEPRKWAVGRTEGSEPAILDRIQYRLIWPRQLAERFDECREGHCEFHGIWDRQNIPSGVDFKRGTSADGPALIGVFARKSANPVCARAVYSASLPQSDQEAGELYVLLLSPLGISHGSGRPEGLRGNWGLLDTKLARTGAGQDPRPEAHPEACPSEFVLAHIKEEPWERAAEWIASRVRARGIRIRTLAVDADAVRGPDALRRTANWDAVLTVAQDYTSPVFPSLASIMLAGASNNFARGFPLDPKNAVDWIRYESRVVVPPPPWLSPPPGAEDADGLKSLDERRGEALVRLEASILGGPAPILPLAFEKPLSFETGTLRTAMTTQGAR